MNNLQVTCPKCKFQYTIPVDMQLTRTLKQNSLYWGNYIGTIANHTGHNPDDLHEEFKLMFNPKDSNFLPGEKIGGSTRAMVRKEFSDYLERIRVWALDFLDVKLMTEEEFKAEVERLKKAGKEL